MVPETESKVEIHAVRCYETFSIPPIKEACIYPVLLRVNEQRNILHEIRKRKAKWIGHILRRNCLLQQVIEGKI